MFALHVVACCFVEFNVQGMVGFAAQPNRYFVCFEKRPLHKFVINSNLSVMEFSEDGCICVCVRAFVLSVRIEQKCWHR